MQKNPLPMSTTMMNMYNTSCGDFIDKPLSITSPIKWLMWYMAPKKVCTEMSMCKLCRSKKSKMCADYHLFRDKGRIRSALRYYFPNIASDEALLSTMYNIGIGAVERGMRSYYENLYITHPDMNHMIFVNNVLPRSYTYDDDPALKNNNYWKVILYTSIVKTHSSEFAEIARTRLNGILDTNRCTARSGGRDFRKPLNPEPPESVFIEFFELYIENVYNNRLRTDYMDKYDLRSCIHIDVHKLQLISYCKILFDVFKYPIKYLYNTDYIQVNYLDCNYYVLTCNIPQAVFSKYGRISAKPTYDPSSYDFLNLIVDDYMIEAALDEINDEAW